MRVGSTMCSLNAEETGKYFVNEMEICQAR
jgi:hypothetical protein